MEDVAADGFILLPIKDMEFLGWGTLKKQGLLTAAGRPGAGTYFIFSTTFLSIYNQSE